MEELGQRLLSKFKERCKMYILYKRLNGFKNMKNKDVYKSQ